MFKTMKEIENEYDGNFVCFKNCEWTSLNDLLGGEVIAFCKDKSEILDILGANRGSYYQYVGEFPNVAGGYLLYRNEHIGSI